MSCLESAKPICQNTILVTRLRADLTACDLRNITSNSISVLACVGVGIYTNQILETRHCDGPILQFYAKKRSLAHQTWSSYDSNGDEASAQAPQDYAAPAIEDTRSRSTEATSWR